MVYLAEGASKESCRLHIFRPIAFGGVGKTTLSDDITNHTAVNVGQTVVAALVEIGQTRVVEPQQVQDGRVNVVNMHAVRHRLEAQFIGLAVAHAAFHAPASQPNGESVGVVVAAGFPHPFAEGMRPNSPPQTTSVESNKPRWARSVSKAAMG